MSSKEAGGNTPHIGKMIERKLEDLGMTKAEFGRRIQTSRQNVNSLLRKPSVNTAFLSIIGKALNHDFHRDLMDASASDSQPTNPKAAEILKTSAEAQAAIARLNLLLLQGY